MDIAYRHCIGDVFIPTEVVDATTLEGTESGYLLNLSEKQAHKWLKAFMMSNKKQKHRCNSGCIAAKNFKILQEMRVAIIEQRKIEKNIDFVRAFVRGKQVVLKNNCKVVEVFLPRDTWKEELSWVSGHLVNDIPDVSMDSEELEPEDSQDPPEQISFDDIVSQKSKWLIRESQRHANCGSIHWRPSRMTFMVKKIIDEDDFYISREFAIKNPKMSRRKVFEGNTSKAVEVLTGAFKSCLQNIKHWLDEE